MRLEIKQGNIFEKIREIPDNTIDLCITSPPYWGLRDYGVEGQLGNEPTMEAYTDNLLLWVKEVWRVLKPTGSFVLNIGDCFIGGRRGSAEIKKNGTTLGLHRRHALSNWGGLKGGIYKPKQLLSVSSFAYCKIITETDFVCRGEHIWAKPNVPSPIRCRLKHSHEKLFWFVKNADRYYFNRKAWMKKVASPGARINSYPLIGANSSHERRAQERQENQETIEHSWRIVPCGEKQNGFEMEDKKPASEHIAPFPTKLIEPYILSLCPTDGVVLDPFLGSGTTMRVSMENRRNCIGIELSPGYIEYAKKRLNWGMGLGIEWVD